MGFAVVGWFALWLALIIGWIMNIVQVVQLASEPFSTLLAVKLVGILVAPLGAILGWIG